MPGESPSWGDRRTKIKREKNTEGDRGEETWQRGWTHAGRGKPSFPKHPAVVSLPTQNQTTQKPWPGTQRKRCLLPHFHTTSGHCCNASQSGASPSQTHPILSNYVNPCKGPSTVCAIQSYQCGLLIRKCKVGHL